MRHGSARCATASALPAQQRRPEPGHEGGHAIFRQVTSYRRRLRARWFYRRQLMCITATRTRDQTDEGASCWSDCSMAGAPWSQFCSCLVPWAPTHSNRLCRLPLACPRHARPARDSLRGLFTLLPPPTLPAPPRRSSAPPSTGLKIIPRCAHYSYLPSYCVEPSRPSGVVLHCIVLYGVAFCSALLCSALLCSALLCSEKLEAVTSDDSCPPQAISHLDPARPLPTDPAIPILVCPAA
jgi:hypothetical protein